MWNRKYVKFQGVKNTGAAQDLSPGSRGFVIMMEEQPPGNSWALPVVSVLCGCFTQCLWCNKAWQHGDGCAQAPKAWRPCSGLIRRCARAPRRYKKLVLFESGLRACRKKHCRYISKTNLYIRCAQESGEHPDDMRSFTTAITYFHMMHIHSPYRWEVMLRSNTVDKGKDTVI